MIRENILPVLKNITALKMTKAMLRKNQVLG
jgi:hypothetical protein